MAVTEMLVAEHETVLGKLDRLWAATGRGDLAEVRALLPFFLRDIQRHRRKEEEVLFPAVSRNAGMVRGPIHCMLEEHRQEKVMLDELERLLGPEEPSLEALRHRVGAFVDFLRDHIRKENEVLYPLCEQLLSPAEKEAVFARMRAIGMCCEACAQPEGR